MGQNFFQAITEAITECFLTEAFAQQVLGVAAHLVELGLRRVADMRNGRNGPFGITMANLPADFMFIKNIRDMAGAGTEEKDGFTGGHGSINFTRVNDTDHIFSEAYEMHIGGGERKLQRFEWLVGQ